MKYPRDCNTLNKEEMTCISGGSALDAFNYLFGDWFRDMLLSDIRSAAWGSMQQLSVQPVVDTGKRIASWFWLAQLAYGYGFYRLFQTVKSFWNQ